LTNLSSPGKKKIREGTEIPGEADRIFPAVRDKKKRKKNGDNDSFQFCDSML
jgi:hypothetical protein